jgi:hypothetical protein
MKEKFEDYFVKFFPFVLTLITVVVGLIEFNKGQKANADSRDYQFNMQILSKFKETQQKVYSETMGLVGYLSSSTAEFKSQKYKDSFNRLNQIYWVDLAAVQSHGVDSALIYFKNDLDNLIANDFRNIDAKELQLQGHANDVAEAIRKSSMDWSLPGGLVGLNGSPTGKGK